MTSRFDEGDVLEIRGNRYRVAQVDIATGRDTPLQYRLDALDDAPPANLKPDGSDEQVFAIREYYNVDGDDIEVIDE